MPQTISGAFPAAIVMRGLHLLNLSMDESLDAIAIALQRRLNLRIAFVNADCVNIAARDEAYREALAEIDWLFIDGVGMRLAGGWMRQPVRDNVNGTDLFPHLCELLDRRGASMYLLGARPGVADAVASWVKERYPQLRIAGVQHGYYKDEEQDDVIAAIRDSKADVLLVAMGAPRQEIWLKQHLAASGARVGVGVGGLFDFYSGRVERAPRWLRACGGEWLFRLVQEPRRLWRRYLLGNFVFLWRIIGGQRVHRRERKDMEEYS